jgi:hypothetical protein
MPTAAEWVKGRNVIELTFTLTFSDTTAAVVVTLPANVQILSYIANVKTALAGGTTQVNIGTSTTATELVAAWSLAALGQYSPTTEVVLPGHATTAMTPIYAVVGAGNTAGEVDVTMLVASDRHRIK